MKYRVIVAGSRDYKDYEFAKKKLDAILKNTLKKDIVFISGCCDTPGKLTFTRDNGTKVYGADGLGERYAKENKILVEYYPADWDRYYLSAGPKRNETMAEVATHCIVFYNGFSKGSKDMVARATRHKLVLREIKVQY